MSESIELPAAASPAATAALDEMLRALQDALRADPRWPAARPHVERAFVAYDKYLTVVTTAHPVTCRAGCTACCHDNPRGVTGVELLRLRGAIARLPDGAAVLKRFATLAAEATDEATWRAKKRPCPLLGEDGRCRTYAARPVACRAFVAMSPAPWCDPEHPRYAERLNPHLDPPDVLVLALRVLSERLGTTRSIDLHRGLAG